MYDILIVGSGPAGLAAAIYGKRANLSVAVIEKNYGGVGQIGEGGHVYNYPGLPGIRGFELGMKFREHASELSVEFIEQVMTKPANLEILRKLPRRNLMDRQLASLN